MIGREILSQGFDVHITQNSLVISKPKIINACSKTTEDEIDINMIDTDVISNDKSRLISVFEKFKDSFITGFPRTRVSTGKLEIRLIDPNVTVQRSPYRLSEEERRIVREIIGELIKANIVRPSNSSYASPMLLVKKKDGSGKLCVDFRELNKNTVADRDPLPLIADQIARSQMQDTLLVGAWPADFTKSLFILILRSIQHFLPPTNNLNNKLVFSSNSFVLLFGPFDVFASSGMLLPELFFRTTLLC